MKPICIKALCFFLLVLSLRSYSQCVAVGPRSCSTTINDAGTGSQAWSNVSNVQLSDNNYTSAGQALGILSSFQTHYVKCTNFGFSLPSIVPICGIKVEMEKHCTGLLIGSSVVDNNIRIVKNNAIIGTNHALGSTWPTSDAYYTYGHSADLWGTSWTAADINSPNFGVVISAQGNSGLASLFLTANIDHVRMTVFYDPTILPVELKDFKCKREGEKIKLNWETASEKNTKAFYIEKMLADSTWQTIAYVSANGNQHTEQNYAFYDEEPVKNNYYRLKVVDHDNSYAYSPTVFSVYDNSVFDLSPNPARDKIQISSKSGIKRIVIHNSAMKELKVIERSYDNSTELDLSDLEPGCYFLGVETESGRSFKKLIKN